jgi:hypothetical protein
VSLSRSSSVGGSGSWRAALERIPTVLGRLSSVAALRDPVSNSYFHPSLSRTFGNEDASREIRNVHYQIFAEWLALGLEGQKADLEEFLASGGPLQGGPGLRDLIPPQARQVEKQLYLADLKTLLRLLEPGEVT